MLAIEGGYEPFAVDVDAPDGASPEAAVVAAAHAILVHYLPDQAATILDPAYLQSLATIPDGQAKDDGVATGEEVAAILIEQRADDGFRAPVTYTPPDPPIPGVWIPTAPSPPIGTYLPFMRPFSLDSPDQFRPGGPPPLSTPAMGRGLQRGQGDRLANEHDPYPRADAGGALLGRASGPAGACQPSASSSSTRGWTSATRHGSWR